VQRLAAIAGIAVVVAAIVAQVPGVPAAFRWLEDAGAHVFAARTDWSGSVVIDVDSAGIGGTTAADAGAALREQLADVGAFLARVDARAIVYDVALFDAHPADARFAATLRPNVVLPAVGLPVHPGAASTSRTVLAPAAIAGVRSEDPLPPHRRWPEIRLAAPALVGSGKPMAGVINAEADEDGVTRRLPLLHGAHGLALPSMPLAAYMAADRSRSQVNFAEAHVGIGGRTWHANEAGEVLLQFPRNLDAMPVVSFERVAVAATSGRPDASLEEMLRNRVVFVGNASPVSSDRVATPAGDLSGVRWMALGYAQLAAGRTLHPGGPVLDLLVVLFALVPAGWLAHRVGQRTPGAVAIAFSAGVAVPMAIGLIAAAFSVHAAWPFAIATGLAGAWVVLGYRAFQGRQERWRQAVESELRNESSKAKIQFLNHLTHELRTPLTAIIGFNKINWLTDDVGKEQRKNNSRIIARNCEQLLTLINNNLDIARLESGQIAITRQPEAPESLISDVILSMRLLAEEKGLELRYELKTALPEALMLDAFRLRQVLFNLIGNAVKFTSRGGVRVTASWHLAALVIEVSDTGPGISNEAIERIWQPFKQADLTVGRRFGGTGLGLAISRKLVDLMEGEVSVHSEVGKGTTFRVRLPSEPVTRQTSVESVAPAVAPRGRLSGRVLLADDNEDLRNLVTLLLRNLGLQVDSVEHGLAAVEAAVAAEYDVLIMDMEMPVMNGFEAVHVLRARGYHGTILGLTAHQEGIEVARAILAGCDAVLNKPVSVDSLKQAIAPVLDRIASRRAAANGKASLPQQ